MQGGAYRDFEGHASVAAEKPLAIDQVRRAVRNKLGKFTKSEIMELCPGVGKATVENALKKLVENGELQRHGSGRATFYTRTE